MLFYFERVNWSSVCLCTDAVLFCACKLILSLFVHCCCLNSNSAQTNWRSIYTLKIKQHQCTNKLKINLHAQNKTASVLKSLFVHCYCFILRVYIDLQFVFALMLFYFARVNWSSVCLCTVFVLFWACKLIFSLYSAQTNWRSIYTRKIKQ
jgi:hypothetical protein